jgi:hypothetical protein
MPEARTYALEQVNRIRQALESLPEKPERPLTTKEVVAALKSELEKKVKSGWSYEELARQLADQGLKVSPATLRAYVHHSGKRRRGQKGQTPKRQTGQQQPEPVGQTNEDQTLQTAAIRPTGQDNPMPSPQEQPAEEQGTSGLFGWRRT